MKVVVLAGVLACAAGMFLPWAGLGGDGWVFYAPLGDDVGGSERFWYLYAGLDLVAPPAAVGLALVVALLVLARTSRIVVVVMVLTAAVAVAAVIRSMEVSDHIRPAYGFWVSLAGGLVALASAIWLTAGVARDSS